MLAGAIALIATVPLAWALICRVVPRSSSKRRRSRVGPFAAGYVLLLAVAGPLAASRSHLLADRLPARLFPVTVANREEVP